MATLPRANKPVPSSSSIFFADPRPQSEIQFDAGINSSAAWTEHLERGSLSDSAELEADVRDPLEQDGQPARALYDFDGKVEFRELIVKAGDDLEVLKEDVGDGWSLVSTIIESGEKEIGLLPRTHYTFTSEFALELDVGGQHNKEISNTSITPRASPTSKPDALPIVPQTTGEWRNVLPSFRQSLLGGKSLNRFSTFVTSGAEEWVLKGCDEPVSDAGPSHSRMSTEDSIAEDNRLNRLGLGEADRHFVNSGPAWQTKVPQFKVLVHSPSKRTSALSGAYTVYSVTSVFPSAAETEDDDLDHPISPTSITVQRRFSHFVTLHTTLLKRLPGIALPPLPEKQYTGRFSADFVEARRGDLERYIGRVVRHPIARYAEVVTSFLGCESDSEWTRLIPQHISTVAAGPAFFAHVLHPDFNVDVDEAAAAVDRFHNHTRGVGKAVQALRNVFGRIREVRLEMSKAERLLSYSLLSMITSKSLPSSQSTGISEEEEESSTQTNGLINEEGAWCWREGCEDCLRLTKATQKTSEALQNVADLYDDHARRTQYATHEALKDVAHPYPSYEGIVETHQSTLSRYQTAMREGKVRYLDKSINTCRSELNEEVASRCETVLNTTMAEMDTYHTQKVEDFSAITKEHLDGEIVFYEQVLGRLRAARRVFDSPQYAELSRTPRQSSRYERDLENPNISSKPLPQPCPHVYDSAPMRPVSVAIQGGMGVLLGSSSSFTGRTSVFGKLW
ncbi:hypothetical protein BJ138DRAFT_1002980 [Hygrophoropsis aurantiaca]|uniref:Uncharacterized protein n=1 Tax=Hygrophoropsis aurantiaca TaxID=72124 RepID=A0ACB8AIN9_9AGAM|nr:hypothetical protein BJ138DRAFT_1002980 [Hygrophoropsis aurantiaca]